MTKKLKHFSIEQICDSGQCFRMTRANDNTVEVIAKGRYLLVSSNEDEVTFNCSDEEYENIWKHYFDIDGSTDYEKIISSIDEKDTYLRNASTYGDGIRILNQDLFEMIISFLISQRNNIKRIKSCIKKLCEKYGRQLEYTDCDGQKIIYYDFPSPKALADANIEDLRSLGLGYRDVYVKRASEDVVTGKLDLDMLSKLNYEEAMNALLELYGVGKKVADCICLFALHHTDAFPMDTHIISIVDREYNGVFPFEKYKGYAGVLQQYMFFYDLNM